MLVLGKRYRIDRFDRYQLTVEKLVDGRPPYRRTLADGTVKDCGGKPTWQHNGFHPTLADAARCVLRDAQRDAVGGRVVVDDVKTLLRGLTELERQLSADVRGVVL